MHEQNLGGKATKDEKWGGGGLGSGATRQEVTVSVSYTDRNQH